jgi:hypothetical protein
MGMRALSVAVLLVAVALVVACGGNQSASREAMEAKFRALDYKMGNLETTAATYGPYLAQATQQYIALVRKYADQLGPDEVKRRLLQKGDEVAPYCIPCMATLEDEAKRY